MKRLYLLFALVLLFSGVRAEVFTVRVASGQLLQCKTLDLPTYSVEVAMTWTEQPTGDLVIPSTVSHNGCSYQVKALAESAFFVCSKLKSVVIPSTITEIPTSAFYLCTQLESVTLPSTITSIGESAFWDCDHLTSIELPQLLTTIGAGAFAYCDNLCLEVPSSVSSIGREAFDNVFMVKYSGSATGAPWGAKYYNYGYLEGDWMYEDETKQVLVKCRVQDGEVTVPSTVRRIAPKAFYSNYCSRVVLPSSVTTIDDSAFYYFRGESVVLSPNTTSIGAYAFARSYIGLIALPNSVTTIGRSCFMNSELKSVVLPNLLTAIQPATFCGCDSLRWVTIPNSVQTIGDSAFYSCRVLEVAIPSSVNTIGTLAFKNVPYIEYYGSATGASWGALLMNGYRDGDFIYTDNTKTTLLRYAGTGGAVTIPSTVTTIGEHAFEGNLTVTSVEIPSSVTRIKKCAFYSCRALHAVDFDEGLLAIDSGAFSGCYRLTSAILPNSLTHLGHDAFSRCYDLESLYVGAGLDTIGNSAFSNCSSLRTIELGAVKSIGNRAFYMCSGFTSLNMPSSLINIGDSAFYYCRGLVTVNFNLDYNTMSTIGSYAFADSKIRNLTIPNCITSIGIMAFRDLPLIHYSGSATGTPWGALSVNGYREGDFVYSDAAYTTLVAYLGHDNCVVIPNTVTTIGANAFKDLVAESVTIPSSVSYIGDYAFYSSRISSLVFLGETPPSVGSRVSAQYQNVYVPCGYESDYSAVIPGFVRESASYVVDVESNNSTMGSAEVRSMPSCDNGVAQLRATPERGYRFLYWSDGDTSSSRYVEVTKDTSFVAVFAPNYYTLTVQSIDTNMGTIQGPGWEQKVQCGEVVSGNKSRLMPFGNYYKYSLTEMLYPATEIGQGGEICGLSFFVDVPEGSSIYHTYTALKIYMGTTNNTSMIGGEMPIEDMQLVYEGLGGRIGGTRGEQNLRLDHSFLYNGVDNLVVVIYRQAGNYISDLYYSTYSSYSNRVLMAYSDDDDAYGNPTATTSRVFHFSNQVPVTKFDFGFHPTTNAQLDFAAVAKPGYQFWRWSDGNTSRERSVHLTQDMNLTAYFLPSLASSNNDRDTVLLSVVDYQQDTAYVYGNCDTVVVPHNVDKNHSNVAILKSNGEPFDNQSEYQQLPYGTAVMVVARPNEGLRFLRWSDGCVDNPRMVVLEGDLTFTAVFAIEGR